MNKQNRMREISIEKVTLNIGVGGPGDKMEKAMKLLTKITNKKPIQTKTMKRIPTWGLRPNLAIGCKVTVRTKDKEELLSRLLKAVENKLDESKFDNSGNFSFGIREYIDIPGVGYDVEIGIIGLEVAVTLTRPGFSIKRRKVKQSKVPLRHKITKEEAMGFIKNKFDVNILLEGEQTA